MSFKQKSDTLKSVKRHKKVQNQMISQLESEFINPKCAFTFVG